MKHTVTNRGIDSFAIQDQNGYDLTKDQIRELIEKADRCDILQKRIDQAAMICTLYDSGRYKTKQDLVNQLYKAKCILDDVRTHYSLDSNGIHSKQYKSYCDELEEDIDYIWEYIRYRRYYTDCPKCGAAILPHSNTKCFLETIKERTSSK